uniref:DPEP2 neighbor protein-like n=1 Tax=Myodes glareolus TaxID=447135 RepID=UPI002020D6A4|nr:DPEP2 neighbor protein-like [Myodes glareolus]
MRLPPIPPTAPPSPGYYHVLYREHAQAQIAWHGETYCLIGGYRVYGDAPLATPAKAEEEKPAPRRARKRQRVQEESDQDLGARAADVQQQAWFYAVLHMLHAGQALYQLSYKRAQY